MRTARLLLATLLSAVGFTAQAATYYVVAPNKAKAALLDKISVSLGTFALPAGRVGTVYPTMDFNTLLQVTGDPAYAGAGVAWSASNVPAGLSLSNTGLLTGTPSVKSTAAGTSFQVNATYKSKTGQQTYSIVINGLSLDVTQVAMSPYHACAITPAGGVKCWGHNGDGQLGDGTTVARLMPVDVVGLSGPAVGIAAGSYHTCAVLSSGAVQCWGYNNNGQLGTASVTSSLQPVSVVGLGGAVAQVSAGINHTCVITTAGGAKCWGFGGNGQLGQGSFSDSLVPVDVQGLTTGVTMIAAGNYHTCALRSTGDARCWGDGSLGQLGNNTTSGTATPIEVLGVTGPLMTGITSISGTFAHGCAVINDGTVNCWGLNNKSQLGNAGIVNSARPVNVLGLPGPVSRVSTGSAHTCAALASGGVVCWGGNGAGQLGDNTTTMRTTPTAVVGLGAGISGLVSNVKSTCVWLSTGAGECWGDNSTGQLGNGTTNSQKTPGYILNP